MNHDQDQAPEWEDFDGWGPTQIGGAGWRHTLDDGSLFIFYYSGIFEVIDN